MNPRAAALKSILAERRSIRRFKPEPVPAGLLREVLDAGRLAPSPTNSQPWYFLVISGEDTEKAGRIIASRVRSIQIPGFRAIAADATRILKEAPHVIAVWNMGHLSGRLKKIQGLIGRLYYKNYVRAEQDAVACAVENMWLMAQALGLGMVWIMAGENLARPFSQEFGVKGMIAALLAVGYPEPGEPEVRTVRKSLDKISGAYGG